MQSKCECSRYGLSSSLSADALPPDDMQGDVLLAQHGCCRPVSPRSSRLPRSPQGPHEVVVPKCDVHYVRRNVRQDACEFSQPCSIWRVRSLHRAGSMALPPTPRGPSRSFPVLPQAEKRLKTAHSRERLTSADLCLPSFGGLSEPRLQTVPYGGIRRHCSSSRMLRACYATPAATIFPDRSAWALVSS
jgi:hypothetical protein